MAGGFQRLERKRGRDELATREFATPQPAYEAGRYLYSNTGQIGYFSGDYLYNSTGKEIGYRSGRYIYSSRDGSTLGYCEGEQ